MTHNLKIKLNDIEYEGKIYTYCKISFDNLIEFTLKTGEKERPYLSQFKKAINNCITYGDNVECQIEDCRTLQNKK